MSKYSIGVDFGSLSGRAVLVDVQTGDEIATAVYEYPHKVMEEKMPNGKILPPDYALQHPQDYLDVLRITIPKIIDEAKINSNDIIGLGIDFTACTVLPTLKNGTPLCFLPKWKNHPHAYVKLWKHHAAQKYANQLNEMADAQKEAFLKRYGGKISSEWMIPKVMEIAHEAPEIYDAMDRFMEATDWIVMMLTGIETRNSCTAGYKAIWHKETGFPKNEFMKRLHPKMENFYEQKVGTKITPIGMPAGYISDEASKLTGLPKHIAVAVGNVDAHVSLPAVGISDAKKMLMIIGTSTCDILLGNQESIVPGMCGVVEDGVIPGFFGYEAGQSCVGDAFDWFVKQNTPDYYTQQAQKENKNIHVFLTEKAQQLKVGESGLLALDWWNGNRSVLVDVDLTGMMIGQTILTKPEEQYRALIESTAFGKRKIIETFVKNGVPIEELYACGGIVEKNPMMMQIYADVTNYEIKVSGSTQTPALGSAMFGAVAAGKKAGGYDSIVEASKYMSKLKEYSYKPIKENVEIYHKIYQEYEKLHDYFGLENRVIKHLLNIKKAVKESRNEG